MKGKIILILCIALLPSGRSYCRSSVPSTADSSLTVTKHYFTPLAEVVGINGMVWAFDHFVLQQSYADISMNSIRNNLQRGLLWDNDNLGTNMFFHPYHGSFYYGAARSCGQGYWMSMLYTLAGSFMWEMAFESEPASANDLLATTIGGSAMGEVLYRLSNRVVSNGRYSAVANVAGIILSPMAWINSRIYPESIRHDNTPLTLSLQANNTITLSDLGRQYNLSIEAGVDYGNFFAVANTEPFDAFRSHIALSLSGGPVIKEFQTIGSLYSKEVNDFDRGSIILGVFQHFDYFDSEAYPDLCEPYRLAIPVAAGIGVLINSQRRNFETSVEVYMKAVALGAVQSDHYMNIDRNYNIGQGIGSSISLSANYRNKLIADIDLCHYALYTWKGFDGETDDVPLNDLYLDAQGNTSTTNMMIIKSELKYFFTTAVYLTAKADYFLRYTNYEYFPHTAKNVFEISLGIGITL